MRPGPAIMLGFAFVCAGFAAILVRNMLTSSSEPSPAAAVVTPATAEKTVVVAAHDLKPGQKLTADCLREVSRPIDSLPKGVFFSKDALLKPGEDRTLAVAVAENEPILPTKFSNGVTHEGAVWGKVAAGMTPVSIRLNENSAVGAVVQVEDWVDILWTKTERAGEGAEGVPDVKASTIPIVQHVRVLATDQQTAKKNPSQLPKNVTVEVNADEVNVLTMTSMTGQLSVALSQGPKEAKYAGAIDTADLLRRSGGYKTGLPKEPVVTVIRTVDVKQYSVPSENKK